MTRTGALACLLFVSTTMGSCSSNTKGVAAAGGTSDAGTTATGGAATGGAAAGGAATGGTITGGGASTSTGGATTCSTSLAVGKDYTHPVYGHGYLFGDAASTDYWIVFDTGLHYDRRTGYGWHMTEGSYSQSDAIAKCASLTVANFNTWKLATVSQLRSLADGCAPSVPGGTCEVQDNCLTHSCGFNANCGSCPGGTFGWGPASCEYCRVNVQLCSYSHTLSNCPDCAAYGLETEWTYMPVNGDFDVIDPSVSITSQCVVTSVPNF